MRVNYTTKSKNYDEFRKKHCPMCVYRIYCCVINKDDSDKTIPIHKGKGKMVCKNYKPQYRKRLDI